MTRESYTPGHTENATHFMATRTFASHGEFFAPYLEETHSVLDVGCGAASISLGIAQVVSRGRVQGIDFARSQVESAKRNAEQQGVSNAEFSTASCYELPFEDASFDRVFCHAVMEHISRPVDALREFARVLKPGGVAGVCSPDFDGTIAAPPSPDLSNAIDAYAELQKCNGGDLRVGKKLGGYLIEAGFADVSMEARYECYTSLDFIGEYLALQLDQARMSEHAASLRNWCKSTAGMFAQCWVSAIGKNM